MILVKYVFYQYATDSHLNFVNQGLGKRQKSALFVSFFKTFASKSCKNCKKTRKNRYFDQHLESQHPNTGQNVQRTSKFMPKTWAYNEWANLKLMRNWLQTFLVIQIVTMILLMILGASGRVTPDRKLRLNRLNTVAMCLSFLITVLNVAITGMNGRSSTPLDP